MSSRGQARWIKVASAGAATKTQKEDDTGEENTLPEFDDFFQTDPQEDPNLNDMRDGGVDNDTDDILCSSLGGTYPVSVSVLSVA